LPWDIWAIKNMGHDILVHYQGVEKPKTNAVNFHVIPSGFYRHEYDIVFAVFFLKSSCVSIEGQGLPIFRNIF